ncbi:MAG: L,D-transpeptidase [Pseudomonadota bacterium]
MMNRRRFLARSSAALAALTAGVPVAATEAYTVPQEHMPVRLRIDRDLPAGDIHVDPNRFFLYFSLGERMAIRYVVGVGRHGLYESGSFNLARKARWPSWTPTQAMIERNPSAYAQYADGMPGGPGNPLGARALYLHDDRGWDTYLRIHGTPKPWTMKQAVSNGCVRLINSHVSHLYDQAVIGARVVLHPQAQAA